MGIEMADLGVVYLYRYCEDAMPVRRFLDSLTRFPAGADYDLHVIFKGFPDRHSMEQAASLFNGVAINRIEVDDSGYDIGSYVKAAQRVQNRRLIFFNTFSAVLHPNWLVHFSNALDRPGVGIAGATGSWLARPTSYEVQAMLLLSGLKRIPRKIFNRTNGPGPAGASTHAAPRHPTSLRDAVRFAYGPLSYLNLLRHYPRHPNPHIRTNAFMIERELFSALHFPNFTNKERAYQFESGRRSMTRQIIAKGQRPVVVGRNGEIYEAEQWQASSTLWQNRQENLLVADNRTRDYEEATPDFKTLLENRAWRHGRAWQYPYFLQHIELT